MIVGFFVISCILAYALWVGIVQLRKRRSWLTRDIQRLFAVASIAVLWNAAGVLSDSQTFSTLAMGLYLAATDWLVIVLLHYTKKYTEHEKDYRLTNIVIRSLAVVDTISMIVNAQYNHVFQCELVQFHRDTYCYEMVPNLSTYLLHLIFVYGLVLLVIITFVKKILSTLKMYRNKYEVVLISFVVIILVNIGYRFLDLPVDLSSLFYGFLAIAICYFSLFYVPRGLVVKLLAFSIRDMKGGIVCYDKDCKCVYYNETAVKLLTFREQTQNIEQGMEEMMSYWLRGRNVEEVKDCSWQYTQQCEGRTMYIDTSFHRLSDEKGNFLGCYLATEDRTEQVELLRMEHYRATHDSLTHILNREGFFDAVRKALSERREDEWYLVCSDIKDFKLVNDLFGVDRGDEVLVGLADMLQRFASETTVFGRIAADRFAACILKENYREEQFKECISEIEDMAKNSVYRMHIHMGVYRISDPDMEISVMCDRAMLAINRIKDSYEQVVSYYDDELGDSLHEGNLMIGEFDRALENEEFHMYLQPQISVDRNLLGAEALVRWVHPEKGLVPPYKFISVFEKSGQIYRLDRYIWEQACRQLKEWKEQGREDIHISVNISPKDFYYVDIYKTFTELVEQYGIDPDNLKLEITETAIMTDLQQQLELLQCLRDYGFSVEIDDFGSGYSSLNTLKDISVDVLKIDMGFLGETEQKERSRTILNSIIAMSKQLGMTIVTEGVETEKQVDYLTDAGCDIFQGYYFDKPMPVDAFEEKYFV